MGKETEGGDYPSRVRLALDAGAAGVFRGGPRMPLLDSLERRFGRFGIPNLALYLVIGQVFVLLARLLQLVEVERLMFAPILLLHGDWWRVFTFLFVVPVPQSMLGFVFAAFGWYLFYMMGSALEEFWGAFRFNLYLFISYALTVGLAFITPNAAVTSMFILGSVFLAFAYLNPDFELVLFFVLPVKIKWLALIAWAWNVVLFIRGGLPDRLQIGASVVAFFLFFLADMIRTLRNGQRTKARRAEKVAEQEKPRHVCYVCGKNDRTHPQLDFRYCSKCAGDQCYCPDHIQHHAHVVGSDERQTG